jgi:hypothetical protein
MNVSRTIGTGTCVRCVRQAYPNPPWRRDRLHRGVSVGSSGAEAENRELRKRNAVLEAENADLKAKIPGGNREH